MCVERERPADDRELLKQFAETPTPTADRIAGAETKEA